MSQPTTKPDDSTGPGSGEAGRVASIAEQIAAVKDDIMTEVRELFAGKPADSGQPAGHGHDNPGDGLESAVNAAVDKVLRGRDQAAAEDAHRAQHAKLEEAAAERPPMERTRRHKFMGWGEPSE